MKLILIYIAIFIANGCSTLSKNECENRNWFNLGKSDAMNGEVEPKTAEYRRDCSEYGLQIKSMDYLKGFENGLKKYCTYNNGLNRGEDGEESHALCEEESPKYKKGYLTGLREFKKKQSIVELKKILIEDNGGKECSFSSDCMKEGICSSGKCERSGNECSSDSDCEYEGSCDSISAWTDYNDNVSVDVCN
ncbi:MAG: hypothetical protein ACJAS4_003520 [Bacteriovoracaceae bacterium]|jgi:hypothetical protein